MKKFKVTKEHLLCNYCRWNEPDEVIKFLKTERDVDLTDDNGIYFRLAVKYRSTKMLNALIEYFEQTKLQGDINSMEYKTALYTLKQMLQQASDMWGTSPEIQEILDKYIPEGDSSDEEAKLTESEHSSDDEHHLAEPTRIFDKDYPHAYSGIREEGQKFLELLDQTKDNPHLKDLQTKKITLPKDLSNIQKVHHTLKNFLHILQNVEMALGELVEEKHRISQAETSLLILSELSERCQTDLTSFLKDIETQSPELLDYDSDDTDFDKSFREEDGVPLAGDTATSSLEEHFKEI